MAHCHLIPYHQRVPLRYMEEATILNVAPLPNTDVVYIPPEDSSKPDAYPFPQVDIANYLSIGGHKNSGMNVRGSINKRSDHQKRKGGIFHPKNGVIAPLKPG